MDEDTLPEEVPAGVEYLLQLVKLRCKSLTFGTRLGLIPTYRSIRAMGGDQGGSVRLPASWCGLYGLKPTFGLVPYTGIAPLGETRIFESLLALILIRMVQRQPLITPAQ